MSPISIGSSGKEEIKLQRSHSTSSDDAIGNYSPKSNQSNNSINSLNSKGSSESIVEIRPSTKKVVRILSVDGGGIRGIIPAIVLKNLERETNKPIVEHFDVMGGTSTGGIIVAGLNIPDDKTSSKPKYTCDDLIDIYQNYGHKIFTRKYLPGPRYKVKNLEKKLKEYFDNTLLSQAIKPMLIPAYDISRTNVQQFTSFQSPFSPKIKDFYLRHVLRATSAAPTYFEPALIYSYNSSAQGLDKSDAYTLIDGGLSANNPSTELLTYAHSLYPPDEYDYFVVSLGTGTKLAPIPYKRAKTFTIFNWVRPIIDFSMMGQSQSDEANIRRMLPSSYIRLQSNLANASPAMDDVSKENIQNLIDEGQRLCYSNRNYTPEFNALIELLGKQVYFP